MDAVAPEPPAVVAVRVQEEQQMEPLPLGWLCLRLHSKGTEEQGWECSCGIFNCFAITSSDVSGLSCFCFFLCSAIIEHTNRVIFLEDDDIAAVTDGKLSIHRLKRSASDDPSRAIQTLQMELQQIMKGGLKYLQISIIKDRYLLFV